MEGAKTIDARGLSCPQPVLMTQLALRSVTKGTMQVLVDSVTARDNVARLAQKEGWQATINEGSGGSYIIELNK